MIHERVICLMDWLLETLLPLRHSNGKVVVQLYRPHTQQQRGGTITLNFIDLVGSSTNA